MLRPLRGLVRRHEAHADEHLWEEVRVDADVAARHVAPYPGKAITSPILRTVAEVFEDFRYVPQLRDGVNEAYVFTAKVEGLEVTCRGHGRAPPADPGRQQRLSTPPPALRRATRAAPRARRSPRSPEGWRCTAGRRAPVPSPQ